MIRTQRLVARLLILAFFAFGFKPSCLAKCTQGNDETTSIHSANHIQSTQAPCHGQQSQPKEGSSKQQRNHCQLMASVCCFPTLTEEHELSFTEVIIAPLLPLTTDVVGSFNPYLPFEPPKAS